MTPARAVEEACDMRKKLIGAGCLLALAGPLWAAKNAKLTSEFKAEFGRTFKPHSTYGVVMRDDIPTTSVYGVKGESSDAHFSIDVVDGSWAVSKGIFDFDQVEADKLNRGEIMELASIGYHDNRVDMRFVSLEAHKIARGQGFGRTEKREPVATNFKFFLPFPKDQTLTKADMLEVIRYIEDYLKVFPSEEAARAYAARMLSRRGGAEPPSSSRATPARDTATRPSSTEKKEIKVGMTPLQVIDILGKPQKEVTFENTSKWTYPELTVIFENGKVKEVRF